jgi:alpha-beta hydrolase superfamily lysophospholipase
MLAPRIAHESKKIKGIIMMAGNSRLLEDVMIDQFKYLASIDTNNAKEKEQMKQRETKELEFAKRADLKPDAPDSLLPLGLPASYWIDINHYNQVKMAQNLTMPVLILQGERDYQVTMDDYNLWKEKLGDKKNVTLKLYPKLNHMFMEGVGKATPAEYDKAGHITLYVINDIANWVKKN